MGPGSIAASVRSMRSVFSGTSSGKGGSNVGIEEESDKSSIASGESDMESVFAYTRAAGLPPSFFRKDLVSCCLISNEAHVYGTHSGLVHLGRPDGSAIRTVRVHRASVLDIASHKSGVVATASIDGTVVIASVEDASDTTQASFRRPVHAIALHPDYTNMRSYISGGTAGQVVLSERSWLKSRTDTVLAQTQSTILALAWPESTRLVWCNEDGITLYNPEARTVLGRVSRPPHSPRADMYRPRICISDKHAIVAWHRSIYVIILQTAELSQRIDVPYTLAGATPFHSLHQFAVLAVEPHSDAELKLIDARTGESTYEDEIGLHSPGGPKLGPNDYYLQGTGAKLWIVSSSDAVIARERTARDHVDWLAEHGRFIDAFSAAKHPSVDISHADRRELGRQAADQAAKSGDWVLAANLLAELSSDEYGSIERDEWLAWSARFVDADELLALGNTLPNIELDGVHDKVLDAAVAARDANRLGEWIEAWPVTIYNGNRIAQKLQAVTTDPDAGTPALLRVLAQLWLKLSEYVKAVQALVAADSPMAFQVAGHYHLWTEPEVLGMLGAVVSAGDGDGGDGEYVNRLRELIAQRAEISPSKVVAQLARNISEDEGRNKHSGNAGELLLFGYLSELGQVDEPALAQFADLVVKLYAKYDPHKLLSFFERTDTYDIEASIELCRKQGFDRELVYLLGRIGRTNESLEIIVTKLQDYEAAVQFARSHDPETWDQLVDYCSMHPALVLELLKCVEVSPARVLASVPDKMRIPGLKTALCKVLNNQETSLEFSTGALAIIRAESQRWTRELRASRLKGTTADFETADWRQPQLVSEKEAVAVPEGTPVTSFSSKIAHLRRIVLGL